MHLENLVADAVTPRATGRFWEDALGTEPLTDEPAGYETRLAVPDGPVLDLCFQQVQGPVTGPHRLHPVFGGEAGRRDAVADPEGNLITTRDDSPYADTGPLAALGLEVADLRRECDFWAWLTGWVVLDDGAAVLRHPSMRGPVLELLPETAPKRGGKNRLHLDVRLEPGDDTDAIAREIDDRGGRELHPAWGDLPWRIFQDPSGNEVCLLPAPR